MYASAMEFLEEERDAWAPFEALLFLDDAELVRPGAADGPTHGWSARDLLGHLLAWQAQALDVARELAVCTAAPSKERMDAAWESGGDEVNARLLAEWRALPLDELRRRGREMPGELRGTLTVVPESRWIRDPDMIAFFAEETTEHYEDHRAELASILAASGRS